MAWTETTRARYERHSGRYASDLTDQEWGLIVSINGTPSWFDVTCHKTSITAVSCAF